jgi:hypothetical protein
MKRAALLILILIAAIILAACGGQRLAQCDQSNTPDSKLLPTGAPFS